MKKTRWLILLTLVVALAAIASGCGGDDDGEEPAAQDTGATDTGAEAVECSGTVGIMGPFTGDAASIGQEQLNWARFAVDTFNEENGTDFVLEEGDTQLDPAQASTVAPQFVSNSDIFGIVGPAGSQEIEAVGEIFGREGIAFVSPSATATDLTERFDTFFRVVPTDADQGPTDAAYMADELGAQKVLIIDDQTSYSTGLADSTSEALEEAGVTVERESVSQDQTDFSALVSGVANDTDVVFLPWQIAANAQLFGNQMSEQGKDAVIFGSDGLFSPDDFSIAGSYVSSFAPDITGLDDPAVQELATAYEEEFGDFGTFGPPTFAATTVVMDAAYRACQDGEEPSREVVLENVGTTDFPESILGQPIAFDENGDIQDATFFIFQIAEDGSYELVQ
ncbi:MAG TPA: branched-chain amino acid ABC transporter substrate-binding protein [Gaiellaceae bacterium]|jgi:branched-chain amino acid transport system substrate-binding protein|nr:branched-chain amino acid ABC transporter substrate-binding protein [Gaiellaceae bacterium]